MSEKNGKRWKVVKDCTGETLRLTLKLKQKFEKKEYDLYTICKVRTNENGEDEYIELYNETFTPKQYEEFFDRPTYYVAGLPE